MASFLGLREKSTDVREPVLSMGNFIETYCRFFGASPHLVIILRRIAFLFTGRIERKKAHFAQSRINPDRLLKNVMNAVKTRQKLAKKRSLQRVNEHFEPVFNEVLASAIVFQQPAKPIDAIGRIGAIREIIKES